MRYLDVVKIKRWSFHNGHLSRFLDTFYALKPINKIMILENTIKVR